MKTSIDKEFLQLSGGEVTGNLTVSGTITGSLSGNATSATKLATSRTIRTNLASTSTASFNGTANITPGVTGVLPVANGGTGSSTEKYLKLTGGNLTGNLTVSGKNVVRSINGTNADSSGNVNISNSGMVSSNNISPGVYHSDYNIYAPSGGRWYVYGFVVDIVYGIGENPDHTYERDINDIYAGGSRIYTAVGNTKNSNIICIKVA